MRLKLGHWVLLSLTGLIIVLLYLAPSTSGLVEEPQPDEVNFAEPPTVEYEIDSALTLIQSEAPMQGILYLRSIAEEHPENFRAQYHLGRFSAQTGQWEKVIARFEKVRNIDPEFEEVDYWIGLANFNLGQKNSAQSHLKRFVEGDQNNKELLQDAQIMLNQIN